MLHDSQMMIRPETPHDIDAVRDVHVEAFADDGRVARLVDVLVLSPLGVQPDHQNRGIGTRLVAEALHAAEQTGAPLLFLEGSPAYYGTGGFRSARPVGFRKPSLRIPDAAFRVATLAGHEPWMTGTLVYSEPFWALDCVGLRGADARDRPEPTSW